MNKLLTVLFLILLGGTITFGQYRVAGHITKTAGDTTLYRDLGSASRGAWVGEDIDGNGKPELILTDYSNNGRVHVFEHVSGDSVALIWSSPIAPTNIGLGTSPRSVRVGDLDNDGLKEIIFPTSNGYYIFEWDGIVGSGNYGTSPSQILNSSTLPDVTNHSVQRNEYFEITDIDGDGLNELVTVYNNGVTAEHGFLLVIRATGDWVTDDPGFSGFSLDYRLVRSNSLGGGQPIAAFSGQFNGTGNKDIIVHSWNFMNVLPIRVGGVANYMIPDTASGKAYYRPMEADGVALLGGFVADVDNDGIDEVYLPTYVSANDVPENGQIYMVAYNQGDDMSTIDSSKVSKIAESPAKLLAGNIGFNAILFGGDWADLNSDGQKELYFGSTTPADVIQLQYNGGGKHNEANWTSSIIYSGEPDVFSTINYRDSLGTLDTTRTLNKPFASKIFGKNLDFNGNGKKNLLVPYQGLVDSVTYNWLSYNTDSAKFVTTATNKIANPKLWIARLIESDGGSGFTARELIFITPEDYKLEQNYPNPFNPETVIRFTLPLNNKISLKIYDVLGKEVATLINNEDFNKGAFEINWNGTNNYGVKVASGTYIAELRFGNFTKTIKMSLMK
jgi:hypothetical protein